MRILYLLQDFPYPPTDGIRWKTYNLLSYMAQHHECHVLSFGAPDLPEKAEVWYHKLPGLQVLGVFPLKPGLHLTLKRAWHICKGDPPSLARWESPAFVVAAQQALKQYNYDVVHCDMLNLAQYWPLFSSLPSVLSTNDAVSMRYWRFAKAADGLWRKASLSLAAWLIARFEDKVLPRFTMVHLVSKVDAGCLLTENPNIGVEVIEIAAGQKFLEIPLRGISQGLQGRRRVVLFFSGSLNRIDVTVPLLKFINEGFKRIRRFCPDVEFIIIGRDAPDDVAKRVSAEPGVKFMRWVENYVEALSSVDIALFLDRVGSGIKTRTIQALAAGKAVVGTSVAFEGIDATNGVHAYICDTLNEVTEAVLRLLQEPDLRVRLGYAARELVRQRYTQESIGRRWEVLYETAIVRHRAQNLKGDNFIPRNF